MIYKYSVHHSVYPLLGFQGEDFEKMACRGRLLEAKFLGVSNPC